MSQFNFTPSELYWRERMVQEMYWHQSQSYEHQREIDQIYRDTVDFVIEDINAFFERYGEREGISKREVVKTVKQTDLNLLANRVREYVENEDFSPEANAMLKEYNLTGRANRAMLLKQKIDLATHRLGNKEERILSSKLSEEITHQMEVAAGIWGMSVPEADSLRSMAIAIENKPFKGGVWSERLWNRQEALAKHLSGVVDKILLKGQNSTTMINEVRRAFDTSAYVAKRLLVTETARVQSESQKELMMYNEFEEYRFLAEPTACEHCLALNEKVFKVEDMLPGVNSSPIHPNCRCSAAPEFGEVEELMIEPPQEEVGQESIETLRRITKQRMDDSYFRNTLTKAQYEKFMREFDLIEDREIIQMYHDYVEGLDYTRGGSVSYYSPKYDTVNIKPSSTHPTKEQRQQFGVIHHEMGHAFDTKLFERLMGDKTGWKNGYIIHEISSLEGYDLDNKIVRDFENTILNQGLTELGPEPPRTINGMFNPDYDMWDITRGINEITKKNNLDNFIKEYREYGSKSREHQSTMAALSDILESTGQTESHPMVWGHGGEKYWRKRNGEMRTSEFFAHATQLKAHNKEGYEILKQYFPESVATYEEMVSDALSIEE